MKDEKIEIEAAFYEFRKMKAFLGMGVSIHVPDVPYTPIDKAQEYVNAMLFIDLISVLDQAVKYTLRRFNLKKDHKKSEYLILVQHGKVSKANYLRWYKDLRNDAAHHFARQEPYLLEQATNDVAKQFSEWGLITGTFNFYHHYEEAKEGKRKIGARVDNIPILEYEITNKVVPVGFSASSKKTLDLSYYEFLDIYNSRKH